MRIVLHFFWLFPIQNRCFFMSTMGKSYSCNPKYIYESMINDARFCDYHYVWCFIDPKSANILTDKRLIIINKKNYIKYFYYLLTSRIVVYNCGGFSYAPLRKKQFILETWHGAGAYKRINLSVEKKSKASKIGVLMAMNQITAFVATSRLNTEMVIRPGMGYRGEVIKSGYPRNDILINSTDVFRNTIKSNLGINDERKVVLYAPTFKGNENNAVNINAGYELLNVKAVKKALHDRFGGEWVFAIRGHQYAGSPILENADFDWTTYPDMQELLLVVDALITDYSSSIWDYALTGKPCFLFTPDLSEYESDDRGFFTPICTWPAIYACTNQSLINTIIEFDEIKYRDRILGYFKDCESYEHGNACEIIKEYILNHITDNTIQI